MVRSPIFCLLLIGAAAVLASSHASADDSPPQPDQFAWQWPLVFPADAELAQFVLTPALYRRVLRDDLSDIVAFNAAGESIPLGPINASRKDEPLPAPRPPVTLPMFPLTQTGTDPAEGFRISVERDAGGQLRRLDAEVTPFAVPDASAWLLDASRLKSALIGFNVSLTDESVDDLNVGVLIEASRDLQHWQRIGPTGALVSLSRNGMRLQRLTLDIPPSRFPYWRLRGAQGEALPITAVQAVPVPAGRQAESLAQVALLDVALAGRSGEFNYRLDGPMPIERIAIKPADRNAVANVVVESRAGPSAAWRERARGVVFSLPGDAESTPLSIERTRDRHWRLRSEPALPRAPTLIGFYREESFVILAQGAGPYRLAAGSASARRPSYPLQALLAQLASRDRGALSLPTLSVDSGGSVLGGEAALAAATEPTPWRQWTLWLVLLVGASAIGAMALQLLRAKPN